MCWAPLRAGVWGALEASLVDTCLVGLIATAVPALELTVNPVSKTLDS